MSSHVIINNVQKMYENLVSILVAVEKERQEYKFTPRLDRRGEVYRKNSVNKKWERVVLNPNTGRYNTVVYGDKIVLGHRDKYRDPTF